jgi:hypothetical protein
LQSEYKPDGADFSVSPVVGTRDNRNRFKGLTGDRGLDKLVHDETLNAVRRNAGKATETVAVIDTVTRKVRRGDLPEFGGDIDLSWMHDDPDRYIMVHNHANSRSLSDADVATLAGRRSVRMSVTGGHNGNVHLLEIPQEQRIGLNDPQRGQKQRALLEAWRDEYRNRGNSTHAANAYLARKKGWRYERRGR